MYVDLMIEMWSGGRVGDSRLVLGWEYSLPEDRSVVPHYIYVPATEEKSQRFIAAVREKPGHVQLSDWYEVR